MFPIYGDNIATMAFGNDNHGHEWVELVMDQELYVTEVGVYETYKPGFTNRISSAKVYEDDNTVWCDDTGVATGTVVSCSKKTLWTTLYTGDATPYATAEEAQLFSPNICPSGYRTNLIRLDFDTVSYCSYHATAAAAAANVGTAAATAVTALVAANIASLLPMALLLPPHLPCTTTRRP